MNEASRRMSFAAYAVAFFFLMSPILDVATNVWPFNVSNEQWRYGLAAIVSNYIVSALFALLITSLVAAAFEHRWVLRLVAVIAIIGAVLLAVMILGLVFDYLQIVNLVRPEEQGPFKIGAMKAGLKLSVVCVVMIIIAIASWRASKEILVMRRGDRKPEAPPAPLVR